jgi:hypothetical protein
MLLLFVGLNVLRMRSFRSFDAQRRRKSLHSTIKRVVLSHIQMVSIVLGLSVSWPTLMVDVLQTVSSVASFSEGVNGFECLYKDVDHSQFFNGVLVFTAIGPLLFAGIIALYWFVLVKWVGALKCGSHIISGSICPTRNQATARASATQTAAATPATIPSHSNKMTYTDADAFISSTVILWFLALPSLLQIGSGSLKCWKVGGTYYLFIDLEKKCYVDEHLWYSLLVACPMIFFYGGILPGLFLLRLHRAGSARLTDPSLMLRWGMLHSGYREEKFWWEAVVLLRKYCIILLVTFDNRGEFQIHIALGILILALHFHDSQHPFGHRHIDPSNAILHRYEMASLLILLFMLWCASFFSLGLCIREPGWCQFMVVLILGSNFLLVGVLVLVFVKAFCERNHLDDKIASFVHRTSGLGRKSSAVLAGGGGGDTGGSNGEVKISEELQERVNTKPKKKRRLSSRELMTLEMTNVGSTAHHLYEDKEVIDMSAVNPMLKNKKNKNNGRKNWKTLKKVLKTDEFKEMRKSKVRRLSNIIKTRQRNEGVAKKEEEDELDNIDVLKDADGRRYSYNKQTGISLWLDGDPEVELEVKGQRKEQEEPQEEGKSQEETSQNELEIEIDEASGRRYSYNKQTGISLWLDGDNK